MSISNIRSNYYRIRLPDVLTDSTHGEMSSFEIICVRIQDNMGNEGLGYTYTVGTGGGAIKNIIDKPKTWHEFIRLWMKKFASPIKLNVKFDDNDGTATHFLVVDFDGSADFHQVKKSTDS